MSDKFIFKGQTTFINKPKETVIQDFQNEYVSGENEQEATINSELGRLLKIVLDSKELGEEEREEVAHAIHSIADLTKQRKASRLTIEGTLQSIGRLIGKATDIAKPALQIISKILQFIG